MKKLRLASVMLILPMAYAFAQATDPTFTKLYTKFKDAVAQRNTHVLASMLAPGFEDEDISGKIESADHVLADFSHLPRDPNRQSQTTILSVNSDGTTAKVVQRYRMTTTKLLPNGEKKAVELVAVSNDIWKRANGTWQLARTVTEEMDYREDGQTLAHKVHVPN
jgi:hypothetical protein